MEGVGYPFTGELVLSHARRYLAGFPRSIRNGSAVDASNSTEFKLLLLGLIC
jgi:hypothetical protein